MIALELDGGGNFPVGQGDGIVSEFVLAQGDAERFFHTAEERILTLEGFVREEFGEAGGVEAQPDRGAVGFAEHVGVAPALAGALHCGAVTAVRTIRAKWNRWVDSPSHGNLSRTRSVQPLDESEARGT